MINVEKLKNSQGKVWLNVASGNYFMDGFIHVDSNWLVPVAGLYPLIKPLLKQPGREWLEKFNEGRKKGPFVYANCAKPLNVSANSVDHILASHFIEHLYHKNAVTILESFHRMLKPGGTLHVIVPDLECRARKYVSELGDPKSPDVFIDSLTYHAETMPRALIRFLRATGCFDEGHHWMYDQYSMRAIVEKIGFEVLEKNETPSAEWRKTQEGQVNLAMRKRPRP